MTTYTSSQLEQLKRAAKKLARSSSLSHSQALDTIAFERGFKNWALLAKHSAAVDAVAPAPRMQLAFVASVAALRRRYLHGDQDERDPSKFYCVHCDFFVAGDHFFSAHDVAKTLDRCLFSIERWKLRGESLIGQRRPDSAVNVLEDAARTAAAQKEAEKGAFYRWLEKSRGRDTVVGDFAQDALRDASFPVGATTQQKLQIHLEQSQASYTAIEDFPEIWKKFEIAERARLRRLAVKASEQREPVRMNSLSER